jgi:hypothetical protein
MPKDLHFGVCKSSFGSEISTVVLYDVNLLRYFTSTSLCNRLSFTSKVFFTSENMSHGNLPCPSCLILSCFARDKCDCHDSSHKCGTVLCASVVSMTVWIRKWKINLTPHLYSCISLPSGRKHRRNLILLLPEIVWPDSVSIFWFECSSLFESYNLFGPRLKNFASLCLLMSNEV